MSPAKFLLLENFILNIFKLSKKITKSIVIVKVILNSVSQIHWLGSSQALTRFSNNGRFIDRCISHIHRLRRFHVLNGFSNGLMFINQRCIHWLSARGACASTLFNNTGRFIIQICIAINKIGTADTALVVNISMSMLFFGNFFYMKCERLVIFGMKFLNC